MENHDASDQLDRIARAQQGIAARLHSTPLGSVALGVLWALPVAAFALGRPWALVAVLVVVVATALWTTAWTRHRGVRPAAFERSSVGAALGGWMLAAWVACFVAGFVGHAAVPAVPVVAALVAAAVVAVLGIRLDRAVVGAATRPVGGR